MGQITVKFSGNNIGLLEFDALSYNHGVSMPLRYSEEALDGQPFAFTSSVFQDLCITRNADMFSPKLNLFCAKGQVIDEIRISILHTGDDSYQNPDESRKEINNYEYVLKKCLLTSMSVGGGGFNTPIETITIVFKEIAWTYINSENDVTTEKWDKIGN